MITFATVIVSDPFNSPGPHYTTLQSFLFIAILIVGTCIALKLSLIFWRAVGVGFSRTIWRNWYTRFATLAALIAWFWFASQDKV